MLREAKGSAQATEPGAKNLKLSCFHTLPFLFSRPTPRRGGEELSEGMGWILGRSEGGMGFVMRLQQCGLGSPGLWGSYDRQQPPTWATRGC